MSRGLGWLQRAILEAYDHYVPQPQGLPPYPWVMRYPDHDIVSYEALMGAVAEMYGGWCTRATRTPECYRCFMGIRLPHARIDVLGAGFDVSFSRALHALVRRGCLVAVTWEGAPFHGRPSRITDVVRG